MMAAVPVNDTIRNKLSQLPHKPGVYLMRDRFARVIYVGKARSLRKRVSQYFHPSRQQGWDLKLKALLEAIEDFDHYVVNSEPEALLLEGKLIKEFRPRYNISFRDDKRFLLLKVNLQDEIPKFALTRLKQDDGCEYFGPFAHSGSVRRTLKMLRTRFGLRGCRTHRPGELDYKHCLYGHLKSCCAPCVGKVSLEEYRSKVAEACTFLRGQTRELVQELEKEMTKAAAVMDFERAAELRDMIRDLDRTTSRTQKFSRMPQNFPLAIDPDRDLAELARILELASPPGRIEGYDISNISGTFKVSSLVSFFEGKPDKSQYRRFKIKSVKGQDDFACMAETIHRRYSRLLEEIAQWRDDPAPDKKPGPALPDLILIDGGRGQLNAACTELAKLNLQHVPVIGLAKEFEEIYRPGIPHPLRIDHSSGALKLLQRVRDESHRFANSFNAELRLKKISESLLDEFPGIGQKRKSALLQKFGSVQRLRKATVEDIENTPGFGRKSAAELYEFLRKRSNSSKE